MTVHAKPQIWLSITPQDTTVPMDLVDFLAGALPGYGLYWQAYAATLDSFFAGIESAYKRGCTVYGTCDSSELRDLSQYNRLCAMADAVPMESASSHWGVGTSQDAHALMHGKWLLANVTSDPSRCATQRQLERRPFRDWRQAMAAGAAIYWHGSYNFTPEGVKQVNTAEIGVSIDVVTYMAQKVTENLAWLRANEPHCQDMAALKPVAPGGH